MVRDYPQIMVKEYPVIILRADIVNPTHVPAAIISTFDRLGNHLLPKLGIQIAIEFFESGWVYFFRTVSDFRNYFGRPMFSKSRKPSTTNSTTGEEPLIWEYKFEHLPPHPPEETFTKILKRFYTVPGALGDRTFEEISTPESIMRYRIFHPSLAAYIASAEELVQAHYMYISFQNNPKIITNSKMT